ncbi:VPS4-associated 1 [Pyrenophora seminiperda CCB06]|uniref:VPS4-associated 1 n=1 Tax=Pyrenophora seminiperda CCB06 TaxID=1302712 RepID=A0A3M7M4V4_9PLEO|nr:VPS4-associated 1 [Pyrenophora seminiperda CCB06]
MLMDFFYICTGHLSDRGFCLPEADEAKRVEEQKKKDELDREIEAVKKEYEEKQKIKREKRKGKDKEKDKEKEKEAKSKEDDEDKEDEKAKDEKIKELSKSKDQAQAELGPRIYQLNKWAHQLACCITVLTSYRNFYQMRLEKLRNAEIAKRNRERLSNPANFPSVPSGNP